MRVCGQRRVPADLLPGKRPVSIVQEAEWASEPVCMGRKISPSAGFELRAVKPVPSRYGDYAIPVALNSSVDGKIRCCIAHTHTHTHTHTEFSNKTKKFRVGYNPKIHHRHHTHVSDPLLRQFNTLYIFTGYEHLSCHGCLQICRLATRATNEHRLS